MIENKEIEKKLKSQNKAIFSNLHNCTIFVLKKLCTQIR